MNINLSDSVNLQDGCLTCRDRTESVKIKQRKQSSKIFKRNVCSLEKRVITIFAPGEKHKKITL